MYIYGCTVFWLQRRIIQLVFKQTKISPKKLVLKMTCMSLKSGGNLEMIYAFKFEKCKQESSL